MGSMSLPQFELKHNLFAKEMRKVDPSIKLIAGGAMPDVMEGADQARRINGQYVPDYLSTADWTGQMILNCLDNIDMISEHYYASGTQHTDMKLQKKVPIDPPLSFIEWQRAPAVQVRAKYEHYQEYLKRIPALRAKAGPHRHRRVGLFRRRTELLQDRARLRLGISTRCSATPTFSRWVP
jgi:alpha-N-arabinofuranosidase